MVEFETIGSKDVEFGRNNFIEISKRKVIGGNEFFALSRGYFLPDKSKRYRGSITLPSEKDKREKIAELIKEFD